MSKAPLVISFLAILMAVGLFVRIGQMQEQLDNTVDQQNRPTQGVVERTVHEDHEIEVAEYMSRIQKFNTKLWASGAAGNLDLVKFYLHELEEAMEQVAKANAVDDDVDVSHAMHQIGLPALQTMENSVETDGLTTFHQQYAAFVLSCNACHKACSYPFIKVQVPSSNRFTEQDFSR